MPAETPGVSNGAQGSGPLAVCTFPRVRKQGKEYPIGTRNFNR